MCSSCLISDAYGRGAGPVLFGSGGVYLHLISGVNKKPLEAELRCLYSLIITSAAENSLSVEFSCSSPRRISHFVHCPRVACCREVWMSGLDAWSLSSWRGVTAGPGQMAAVLHPVAYQPPGLGYLS